MCTSATDGRRRMARTSLAYLLLAVLCALFGAVYEHFSHEVFSPFMLYAFGFPLAGGAVPFSVLALYARRLPGRVSRNLYHSGIASLTVGSLMQGVLEIYGTTSRLLRVYWIAGAVLLLSGIAAYLAADIRTARHRPDTPSDDTAPEKKL